VPLPAVSSLGGFQTLAAVPVETFVTAGVWKPSQLRKLSAFVISRNWDSLESIEDFRELERGGQNDQPNNRGDAMFFDVDCILLG